MGVTIEESANTRFFKIPTKDSDKTIYKVQFHNQEERNEVYRCRMNSEKWEPLHKGGPDTI